jgi:hypothetical protein
MSFGQANRNDNDYYNGRIICETQQSLQAKNPSVTPFAARLTVIDQAQKKGA